MTILTAPYTTPADEKTARNTTRNFLLLVWAVAVFSLCMSFGLNSLSTDDATRLVEVRDFLAGQSWFDMTQYRLDPPAGVVMHWSRLLDLPLALAIKFGSLFLSTALAEKTVLIVWPTALLLVFLAGVSRLARELGGEMAARVAPVFAVLMVAVTQNFRIGALHHHSAQLVLIVWALAFFVRAPANWRNSAIAGLLCAVSVAVGQEMVPAVATLAAMAAVRWIVEGERYARAAAAFGGSIAAGTAVLAIATIAPADYLTVHCDAISIAQVGALGLGGFGLAALTALPMLNSIARRLAAGATLAALLGISLKLGAPQCLGDPYAQLNPRLAGLWLSSVAEARSFLSMWRDLPQEVPAYYGVPLAAVVLGIVRCLREQSEQRWSWIAATALQAAFVLVSIWQLRGATGGNALGAALVPAALLQMMPATEKRPSTFGIARPALVALLLLNPAALLAIGKGVSQAVASPAVAARHVLTSGEAGTCQHAGDYKQLTGLPKSRVLAFIDSGPFILMESDHSVFAAPYHRNQAGNLAMFDMFLATPEHARTIMAEHGIDYVAFCPGAPERYEYAARAPNGLAAALADNRTPGFLEKISPDGAKLSLYRVRP